MEAHTQLVNYVEAHTTGKLAIDGSSHTTGKLGGNTHNW